MPVYVYRRSVKMDRNCQNCDKPVEESWTLCKTCRRGYARLLHRLRVNLHRLQSVARREYRLTEPGNGGRPQGGDAPAPVDLHAVDLLDQTEQAIEQACADAGTWLGRWQWLAKRAPVILPLLCRASNAGWRIAPPVVHAPEIPVFPPASFSAGLVPFAPPVAVSSARWGLPRSRDAFLAVRLSPLQAMSRYE